MGAGVAEDPIGGRALSLLPPGPPAESLGRVGAHQKLGTHRPTAYPGGCHKRCRTRTRRDTRRSRGQGPKTTRLSSRWSITPYESWDSQCIAFVCTKVHNSTMTLSGFGWDDGNWPKCGKHGVSRSEIEQVLGVRQR